MEQSQPIAPQATSKPAPSNPLIAPAPPPQQNSSTDKLATMKQQLIKLKRIAQLYKDEVGKHKKALIESRTQTQQRNDMIAKLKNSLIAMKEQHKKQQLKYKQQLQRQHQKNNPDPSSNDVLGARRPMEVLLRIRHNGEHWCLVRFESNKDDDDDDDYEEQAHAKESNEKKASGRTNNDEDNTKWIKQNVLETQTYEQYGLRMDMPEVVYDAARNGGGGGGGGSGGEGDQEGSTDHRSNNGTNGRSLSGLREELDLTQHNLERVQEEFRRYRVRSEIQKKQQETELNRVMQANLAFQQRRIAGDDGINAKLRESEHKVDDLCVELKSQKKVLNKHHSEMEKYKKENSQLMQLLETGNRRRDSEGILGKYKELQKEYEGYKARAMEALKHKDAAIKRALNNGGGGGGGGGGGSHSKHSKFGASARVLPKNATTEYLKNTIIQYMATDQVEVKEHMEAAIATVLQFTNQDVDFLKARREAGEGWVSSVSNYFR